MTRKIPLTRGKVALVDNVDYEWLSQTKWYCSQRGYAVREIPQAIVRATGHSGFFRMHRVLMNAPDLLTIDHINGDTLDNRRINLRLASQAQQTRNCRRNKRNTSGYKGVSWNAEKGKWSARAGGKPRLFLGYFDTAEQAAIAYNKAARQLFGEFCRLNDVKREAAYELGQ